MSPSPLTGARGTQPGHSLGWSVGELLGSGLCALAGTEVHWGPSYWGSGCQSPTVEAFSTWASCL